jgi:proteasome lid subunit RPN8/RPN11
MPDKHNEPEDDLEITLSEPVAAKSAAENHVRVVASVNPAIRINHEPIVWIDIQTLSDMKEYAEANLDREVGGFLLGYIVQHESCSDIYIAASLKAQDADEGRASLTFTHLTWDKMSEQRQLLYPEYKVVGWYHTHPGYGAFYSSDDIFIQKNFFAGSEYVGIVLDPIKQEDKFYQWLGKLVKIKSQISALNAPVKNSDIAVKEIRRKYHQLK